MKRIIKPAFSLALICAILLSAAPALAYSGSSAATQAKALKMLGLFNGTDSGFELDRAPTRMEALIMLLRMTGQEKSALEYTGAHPFTDAPDWPDGEAYISYAFNTGLTKGVSETSYDPTAIAGAQTYITLMLRALGHDGSAAWENWEGLAQTAGLLPEGVDTENFRRGDVVLVSFAALGAQMADGSGTLAQKLIGEAVFTAEELAAAQEQVSAAALHIPDVPENERVEDEWFEDAAFLGHSLMDGFRMFSGLTTGDMFVKTSMTVRSSGSFIESMAAKQYGKIYILLGVNEIGFDPDYFKEQYAAMLDSIIGQQPQADIYILSLTPVSAAKSAEAGNLNMTRVKLYNERLYALAAEKGCYYIDMVDALADETGYLPAAVTSDGVHFSASHYKLWMEYLRVHHI